MLRAKFSGDLKAALKARDAQRLSTLRLITAAIKDRDIAARTAVTGVADRDAGVSDAEILAILARMIKQRQESAKAYDEAGRLDLAAGERAEIGIIQEYLPKQLSEAEVKQAIAAAVEETGAQSIRDMGRVMAQLKSRYTGQMDFARAGEVIKDRFR